MCVCGCERGEKRVSLCVTVTVCVAFNVTQVKVRKRTRVGKKDRSSVEAERASEKREREREKESLLCFREREKSRNDLNGREIKEQARQQYSAHAQISLLTVNTRREELQPTASLSLSLSLAERKNILLHLFQLQALRIAAFLPHSLSSPLMLSLSSCSSYCLLASVYLFTGGRC